MLIVSHPRRVKGPSTWDVLRDRFEYWSLPTCSCPNPRNLRIYCTSEGAGIKIAVGMKFAGQQASG